MASFISLKRSFDRSEEKGSEENGEIPNRWAGLVIAMGDGAPGFGKIQVPSGASGKGWSNLLCQFTELLNNLI